MGKQSGYKRIKSESCEHQTLTALQQVIDKTYRELLEATKADWQRLFAGTDASDTCVTVRINATMSPRAFPRAGHILKRAFSLNGKTHPRLA